MHTPVRASKWRAWLGSSDAEGPGTAACPPLPAGHLPQPQRAQKACSAQGLGDAEVHLSILDLSLMHRTASVFWRQCCQWAECCSAVQGKLVVVPDLPLTHCF